MKIGILRNGGWKENAKAADIAKSSAAMRAVTPEFTGTFKNDWYAKR